MNMDVKYQREAECASEVKEKTDYVSRKGISREEVMETYVSWASNYEKDMRSVTFKGPFYVAEETDRLLKDKENVRLLDACAGTGRVGQDLVKFGFSHIDALDGSVPMLEQAKKLNIYENFHHEYLGPNKINIPDNTYDAVVTTGSFVPGHVKDDCFEEIIRIIKPGGYFILCMGERYFETDREWTKTMIPHIQELEATGTWKKLTERKVKDYMYDDTYDGILYVFQKC